MQYVIACPAHGASSVHFDDLKNAACCAKQHELYHPGCARAAFAVRLEDGKRRYRRLTADEAAEFEAHYANWQLTLY